MKKKTIVLIVISILVVGSLAFVFVKNELVKKEHAEFAAAFASKKWYYSTDGGAHWLDRAEGGLNGFDENSNPVHVSSAWTSGEWLDGNTILWRTADGQESLWKAFEVQPY